MAIKLEMTIRNLREAHKYKIMVSVVTLGMRLPLQYIYCRYHHKIAVVFARFRFNSLIQRAKEYSSVSL